MNRVSTVFGYESGREGFDRMKSAEWVRDQQGCASRGGTLMTVVKVT